MDNSEFALKLEIRTQKFALSIINLSTSVKDSLESKVLRRQIVKSGTSIGANYREANRARSRPDFAIKIRISEGEASETVYWLNLLIASKMVKSEVADPILNEAKEILAIFTSISKGLRK